ncbi:Sua5/YciO/YrdC/YwlC family protein [Streptococcus criceti]|uniref:L-threonylcarbamoyladenylate synthase n=1 Tax=Streptococcus criceti HS-6 TaxID=873449 RepID=G5JPG3_STRCG|nr:L-threonylcarbamoyladenylate synthase [Streptococcus criceti]EHI74356.1 Sua5/YciO/YrdC family protein [Streptococcus criceti HS-6]SUN43270.1 Sua5/YciO/YrdC/YwlC family protein [Streptococcus criceti]
MVDKAAVAKILAAGGAVVLPTETVYGLFAKALNQQAVERVYDLKQRPLDKAMNLNVASLEDILAYSKDQPVYLAKLYQAFLPGPLTIILKANDKVPSWVNSGLSTVGFRLPDHPLTRELIREYGPLIGPSANLSGRASGTNFKDIIEQLGNQVIGVADDPAIQGLDSTILDLSGDRAIILRQGTISKEALLEAVPELNF